MAKDTNMVIIACRLTKDAELKYTNSGAAITNISVANTKVRKAGDEWIEEPNFFEVSLFGRQGEALNQYLNKGQQVVVTGELDYQSWEKDGQKRSKVIIKALNIQLVGGNKSNNNNSQNSSSSYQNNSANAKSYNNSAQSGVNYGQDGNFEDDIPF